MNGHAVVIGGGIGGLLAAHALAGRFERVTILERDRYPSDSSSPAPARRGVPQSRCLHLLLAAGADAFDDLTPGWRDELIARGAVPFDASADAAIRFPAGWLPRTACGITLYACSRALLEDVLRRGFARKSMVRVHEGRTVLALLGDPLGERVTGVRTAETHGSGHADILADLIVDASGRSSTLPRWLARLPSGSASEVEETVVESERHYVSRWFELEPGDAPDWHCLSIAPGGAHPRSAMMLRAEKNRWGVVLLAPTCEPLPSDDKAFLDFTADLGDGKLREALIPAVPVSPIHRYDSASNRVRHYDRLATWPDGLVALGDSVCALDPYFGLGMTVTARAAVLLARHLDKESGHVPAVEFQKELASLNVQPWRLATGRDHDGQPVAKNDLGRLYELAPTSPEVAHALLAVQHLLRPADSLTEIHPL